MSGCLVGVYSTWHMVLTRPAHARSTNACIYVNLGLLTYYVSPSYCVTDINICLSHMSSSLLVATFDDLFYVPIAISRERLEVGHYAMSSAQPPLPSFSYLPHPTSHPKSRDPLLAAQSLCLPCSLSSSAMHGRSTHVHGRCDAIAPTDSLRLRRCMVAENPI